ncbi:serine/arginine-rich splicing factor 3 isoform X4 [Petromyzon marinus]|uniref:serine/arginine-rich splicing factor 3 isoform X4 n=1 Tax=Petromyzon marinus TaxID=7757 RepID=UPI003F72E0AC
MSANCPLDCKVYVGNLGNNGNKAELERSFSYYGPLRSVWVARAPPGFAFVEFEDPRDAGDAVRELDGRSALSDSAHSVFAFSDSAHSVFAFSDSAHSVFALSDSAYRNFASPPLPSPTLPQTRSPVCPGRGVQPTPARRVG